MMKKAIAITLAVGIAAAVSAQEPGVLARFDGGVGVIPVQNVVRGVLPGVPWRIADLKATVDVDGRIRVIGRGLLLASGNSIGRNANQSVFATLICEAAAPFVRHNTSVSVPLDANGDFRIDDTLTTVPAECPSPVLLIRNNAAGVWFAAGIPKRADEK